LHLINLCLRSDECWDTILNHTLPFIKVIKNLLVGIHCIEQMQAWILEKAHDKESERILVLKLFALGKSV